VAPDTLGLFFLFFLVPSVIGGGSLGVLVTALTSWFIPPTSRSVLFNMALGAVGWIVGFYLLAFMTDGFEFRGAFLAAVLACAIHETFRWLRLRRRSL
jgi:uncharacterized membrane protein YeaQ/YmgE (transglycosylase-associated protein family)